MKRLALLALLITPALRAHDHHHDHINEQHRWTWKQKAGIACLLGAGALGVYYHDTVIGGAVTAGQYVHNNPGKTMIGLGLAGVALLANRDVINDLNGVANLARKIQKLLLWK